MGTALVAVSGLAFVSGLLNYYNTCKHISIVQKKNNHDLSYISQNKLLEDVLENISPFPFAFLSTNRSWYVFLIKMTKMTVYVIVIKGIKLYYSLETKIDQPQMKDMHK